MINVILFDDDRRDHLLPLCYTRPVADLRVGLLTIREKWKIWLGSDSSTITQSYLAPLYPLKVTEENWVINARLLPTSRICNILAELGMNEALMHEGELIATKLDAVSIDKLLKEEDISNIQGYVLEEEDMCYIKHITDLTVLNEEQIQADFNLLTEHRASEAIPSYVSVRNRSMIHVEEGVEFGKCILNASDGPIYIGKNVKISDGAILQGNVGIMAGSQVNMAARIKGPTTIGPVCKVGGEITRSIFQGYSNKGHDGFLGDSVIGQWCNLGADTNNSNLKNNYKEVKLWNYTENSFTKTGRQFVGLFMGDHSKCGINTMFNTGTVVGVSANVYGDGYQRNFIPSFAWGGTSGFRTYRFKEAMEVARIVMQRRQKTLSDAERTMLETVFSETAQYRSWEK